MLNSAMFSAALAALALFVGVWHLRVYCCGFRTPEQLFFSLSCFAIGLYDVGSALSGAEPGAASSARWFYAQSLALTAFVPCFVWFVLSYTRQGLRVFGRFVTVVSLLQAAALLVLWNSGAAPGELTTQRLVLPWGQELGYLQRFPTQWVRGQAWIAMALVAVLVGIVVRYFLNAQRTERRRSLPLTLGMLLFLVGGLLDALTVEGILAAPYVLEYAFLGLILAMGGRLSGDVLELAHTRADLRRSHQRLEHLLESLQDIHLETSLDGRLLELSESARRFGLDPSALRGTDITHLYARPGQREEFVGRLLSERVIKDLDVELQLPSGQEVTGRVSARLLDDDGDGSEPTIIVAIRDVTAARKNEEEQELVRQQLRHTQKLESLGILAGGMAHDFNNLLSGILGSADLARLDLRATSPAHKHLTVIRQASLRAADLCQQMLAYSGRGKFQEAAVELNQVVEGADELLRATATANGRAQLQLALGGELPVVRADPAQLRQLLLNLVSNAAEAVGDQPGTIRVATGLCHATQEILRSVYFEQELPEGRYVTLEVSDTGCGVEGAILDQIFDPFFTTKFTGRGLGLAAVLGIVRGHHGTLQVESDVGAGTTFRVLLPAVEEPPSEKPPPDATQDERCGLVLVADDEPSVRAVASGMLEHLGFDVELAEDGQSALAAFRRRPGSYRFVIVDLTMPDTNGVDVLRGLKKIRPEVEVLLCSGYSEQELEERCAGEQVAGFLQKPFSLATLQAKLQHFDR